MNRWKTFTDRLSNRYKKYRKHIILRWNIRRLRLHQQYFHGPSKIHITCTGAVDGGCAQLGRQLSAISFAHAFGFTYIHTPLSYVSHNTDADPAWADAWENFLQLSSFGKNSSTAPKNFKIVENMNELLPEIIRRKNEPGTQYYQIRNCHPYLNRKPDTYQLITDKLRQSYRQNGRALNLIYNKKSFNIAIHVRRGDVSRESNPLRFTSAEKLKGVIEKIQAELKSTDYNIYLFCMNLDDDLKKLESEHIRVVHEMDIFGVLDHLIHADLFVMSKSSVSYVSALLNQGIIIYEPFWHRPLSGWLNMDGDFVPSLGEKLSRYFIQNHT